MNAEEVKQIARSLDVDCVGIASREAYEKIEPNGDLDVLAPMAETLRTSAEAGASVTQAITAATATCHEALEATKPLDRRVERGHVLGEGEADHVAGASLEKEGAQGDGGDSDSLRKGQTEAHIVAEAEGANVRVREVGALGAQGESLTVVLGVLEVRSAGLAGGRVLTARA